MIYYMKNKINIIFDIDDTLVHTEYNKTYHDKYIRLNNEIQYIITNKSLTFIRDYTYDLLNYCFNYFNVGFWSTGTEKHILPIIKKLIPNKNDYNKINLLLCRHRYNPQNTIYKNILTKKKYKISDYNYYPIKPLDLLFENPDFKKKFNKNNTILIDDSAFHVSINPNNSIFIPTFCYQHNDNILFELLIFLDKNKNKKNIKNLIKNFYDYKNNKSKCYHKKMKKLNLSFGDLVKYKNKDVYIIKNSKNKVNIYLIDDKKILFNIPRNEIIIPEFYTI